MKYSGDAFIKGRSAADVVSCLCRGGAEGSFSTSQLHAAVPTEILRSGYCSCRVLFGFFGFFPLP